ncbi:MAG TPA: hypothetical protein VLT33_46955 [Labilithrix sp.]|nr:hypothetical protein [Labilithrix sp.]
MLRRVTSLGLPGTVVLPLLVGVAALAPACGNAAEAPHVAVSTSLVLPKGVLDRVTKLRLTVLEGNVACDPTIGQTTLPGGTDAARQIAQRDLGTTNCTGGAKWCGDLDIEKSETPRVFSAEAKGDGDTTIAIGCATATVNQDALPVPIKMFRFIAPAVCGDKVIQPTEQCEPGGSATCDSACTTKELLLSVGSSQTGTSTGAAGDKSDPFLLWPQQSGKSGRFFAFYTDRAVSGSNNFEVALRALTDDLSPIGAAEFPALAAGSIFLPNDKAVFPPEPAPRKQQMPQAASLNGKMYVVFEDDTGTGATGIDIHLRSMNEALEADQGSAPLGINGGPAGTGGTSGSGEAAVQQAPAIAGGPMGRLFVAWEDLNASSGAIAGRTLTPPSTLGAPQAISSGNGNKGVSVAGTPTGWIVVWQSGTGIKLRVLNQDGVPQGSEQTVNDSGSVVQRPRVASLADGRFAVTWSASGDIFVQRYDAKGAKIAGDQATAINDVVKAGEQSTPSIAGTAAAGGSYVAVWLDAASSNVQGRMLGGSAGFLFNNVNGQSTEFQASRSTGRERANPVVVAGGSGPFVAIAWEDKTSPGAGIIARRFPLPSE